MRQRARGVEDVGLGVDRRGVEQRRLGVDFIGDEYTSGSDSRGPTRTGGGDTAVRSLEVTIAL